MVHTLRQYIRHFALSDVIIMLHYMLQNRDREKGLAVCHSQTTSPLHICLTFAGTLHFMQITCNIQYFLQSIPFVAGP